MREILKNIPKEFLYDYYTQIVDNPIEYEKITRFKMHDDALEILSKEPNKLKKLLSVEELENILRITQETNENGYYYSASYFNYPSGIALFGFEKFDDNTFKMEPNIREYFKNFKYSEGEEELLYFTYVVEGMIETYGIIEYEAIEEIYANLRDKKYKKYPPMIIRGNKDVEYHIFNKRHRLYLDAIIHENIEEEYINDYFTPNRELYPLDFYYNMGRYKLPFENTDEYEFFKREGTTLYKMGYLNRLIQVNPENMPTVEDLKGLGVVDSALLEQYKHVLLNTPIWKYGGSSVLYKDGTPEGAVLPEDLQQDFLTFMREFLIFGNHKYRLFPKNNKPSLDEAFHILNHFLSRKNIVNMYSKSRFYAEVDRHEEFKTGLENAIKMEMGYAFGYEEGKLLIFEDGFVFEVTGITHTIEENLPEEFLPALIEIVLIPLNDTITYGITMEFKPSLKLTPNMRNVFDREIEQAKRIQSIFDVKEHKASIQKINE